MKKIIDISFLAHNKMICIFASGEERMFDLSTSISDKYAKKILSSSHAFKSAKIGAFGEIYWADMAEIKDLDGKIIPCEYDISPEFVYENSVSVDKLTTHESK